MARSVRYGGEWVALDAGGGGDDTFPATETVTVPDPAAVDHDVSGIADAPDDFATSFVEVAPTVTIT